MYTMYIEGSSVMNKMIYFFLGAVVGAILALLYAPQTGEELRAKLQTTAEEDWQKLLVQSQVELQKVQERLDQIQSEQQQAATQDAAEGEGAGEPA
jgi:gas vesicle protein